jgi:hypothetical protein
MDKEANSPAAHEEIKAFSWGCVLVIAENAGDIEIAELSKSESHECSSKDKVCLQS